MAPSTSIVGHQGDDPVTVTLCDNALYTIAGIFVDWKETTTEHVFKADLPGLRKEVVRVLVDEYRMLTISGQRKREEVQMTDTWHRLERSSGHFLRRFRLPENVNLDAITANVDCGVLTVVVPKVEMKTPQTRIIDIAEEEAITQDDINAPESTFAHAAPCQIL